MEVNRFSFFISSSLSCPVEEEGVIHRYIVRYENDRYHIDTYQVGAGAKDQQTALRKDIHGPMTTADYIAWMVNIIANECLVHANREEKDWMFSELPLDYEITHASGT